MYRLHNLRAAISQGEARRVYETKGKVVGLCPALGCFSGTKPIELLAFLANLKVALYNCEASKAEGVRILAYLQVDSAKDVYETYTAPGAETGASSNRDAWPVVINALVERLRTEDVLQAAYDEVTQAVQQPGEDKLEFGSRFSKATRQCRHILTPSEQVNCYVRRLQISIREELVKTLRRLLAGIRSNLSKVCRTASANRRLQRALLGSARPKIAAAPFRSGRTAMSRKGRQQSL